MIAGHNHPTVIVGGIETLRLSRNDLTELVVRECQGEPTTPKLLFEINGHALALALWDKKFRSDLLAGDFVHADGESCVMASRYLTSTPIPERTVTTDFFHDVAAVAVEHDLSYYLLGGTKDNNAQCAEEMMRRYPGLSIVGRHHGFFSGGNEATICDQINLVQPDVVWVGLGKPKEVAFCVRNRDRIRARWMITCGGCFNYVSGTYDRAPIWMQKNGLEWLFRMVRNPKQLGWRYLTTNPVAAVLLLTLTRKMGH
jgi:N-acetylglucosaminyldiphosphoundecaprenol N-acetyl-beta-D-mannosaminyltransferase